MRLSPGTVHALVLLATGIEAALTLFDSTPVATAVSFLAAGGLLLRHRVPWVALFLTLPGLAFGCATIAAVVAVYALAVSRALSVSLGAAVGLVFGAGLCGQISTPYPLHPVATLTSAAMFALAPAAVGVLSATRRSLVQSLAELRAAQETQRAQAAAEAVRHERALLAREMHDVVSHQVSLMAVQAGALQVRSTDEATREGARTIRALCVATLDELRGMLRVLRAGDRSLPPTTPQPALSDLPALFADADLPLEVAIDLPESLSVPVQRAVFRTIQESLTNVRKHAPGSAVVVSGGLTSEGLEVRVRNSPARRPALTLPSSGLGLIGLHERAQLLGGTVVAAETIDGGYETTLLLPRAALAETAVSS